MHLVELITSSFLLSLGMLWQVLWSLILGFLLSSVIQVLVPKEKISDVIGRNNIKSTALATLFGAISSSCSYAAASMSHSLFKKGAGLIPSLAFLFSSTNLVLELGIILFLLMGWQFTLAEWLGGIVLIAIMFVLIKLTYSKSLIRLAKQHQETSTRDCCNEDEHAHHSLQTQETLWKKLQSRQTQLAIAQTFVMEFSMLRNDLLLGFLLAGIIGTVVPHTIWQHLFLPNSSQFMQTSMALILGPVIAVVSFVCSIGNVPLAAILWSSGMPFGGVLAFLYADLIVLPLIDVYRKYYGWKMAVYITAVFFVTMVIAAGIMTILFIVINQIPPRSTNTVQNLTMFSLNYTFWLNILFGGIGVYLLLLNQKTIENDY